MVFASRASAGQELGERLGELQLAADLVLGLPRGGVVVAAAVARTLRLPLDVLVVRKIGHPLHREFAVGALAEPNVVVLDPATVGADPVLRTELDRVVAEETARLEAYRAKFHRAALTVSGKAVLLVDDGLATGATTEAAVLSLRRQEVRLVIVAVPVASTHAARRIGRLADRVVALEEDPDFVAVGQYYEAFSQTTDQEVLELLQAA